jgi:hypothetical protein
MLHHEFGPGTAWSTVPNPRHALMRIEHCNSWPTVILTTARRVGIRPVSTPTPQQSDYVTLWSGDHEPASVHVSGAERLGRWLPVSLKRFFGDWLEPLGFRSKAKGCWPSFHERVHEDDVLHSKVQIASIHRELATQY